MARRAFDPSSVAGLGGDTLITYHRAVALIASRDRRSNDEPKSAADRARSLLRYHVLNGSLTLASGHPWRVRVAELGRLLRKHRAGQFDDIPADVTVGLTGVVGTAIGGSVATASSVVYPDDVPTCHLYIEHWTNRVIQLEQELRDAKQRIDELRPGAEKWENWTASQRKRAQKERSKRDE